LKGFTPAKYTHDIFKVKMPGAGAEDFKVPKHLVEHFELLGLHMRHTMQDWNPNEPAQHERCLVCQLRGLIPEPWKREAMVQFLIFSEAHILMFKNTPRDKHCQECGGRLPLGKDTQGRERDCEYI
jgi:hypothetical protein